MSTATTTAIYQRLHGANAAAHRAGETARAHDTPETANPYTGDRAYWWREGFHGRHFETLTSPADYDRIAYALRSAS